MASHDVSVLSVYSDIWSCYEILVHIHAYVYKHTCMRTCMNTHTQTRTDTHAYGVDVHLEDILNGHFMYGNLCFSGTSNSIKTVMDPLRKCPSCVGRVESCPYADSKLLKCSTHV